MAFNERKYLQKLKKQRETNPGNKEPYTPLYRGRAAAFKSKKDYNRQREKLDIKNGKYD